MREMDPHVWSGAAILIGFLAAFATDSAGRVAERTLQAAGRSVGAPAAGSPTGSEVTPSANSPNLTWDFDPLIDARPR